MFEFYNENIDIDSNINDKMVLFTEDSNINIKDNNIINININDEYKQIKSQLVMLWEEHLKNKKIIIKSLNREMFIKLKTLNQQTQNVIERFFKAALKNIANNNKDLIFVNNELCMLNKAPFEKQWSDMDIPTNYILAEYVPLNKISQFEKFGFGIWIQDDTGFAVMYTHQNDFKKNISKMDITKEDTIKFNTQHCSLIESKPINKKTQGQNNAI